MDTFDIGGDLTVGRLGFGAMRITGETSSASPTTPTRRAGRRRVHRRLQGNVDDALSAGKTGVLMRQSYSGPAAINDACVVDSRADVTRPLAWRVRSSPGETICEYSR